MSLLVGAPIPPFSAGSISSGSLLGVTPGANLALGSSIFLKPDAFTPSSAFQNGNVPDTFLALTKLESATPAAVQFAASRVGISAAEVSYDGLSLQRVLDGLETVATDKGVQLLENIGAMGGMSRFNEIINETDADGESEIWTKYPLLLYIAASAEDVQSANALKAKVREVNAKFTTYTNAISKRVKRGAAGEKASIEETLRDHAFVALFHNPGAETSTSLRASIGKLVWRYERDRIPGSWNTVAKNAWRYNPKKYEAWREKVQYLFATLPEEMLISEEDGYMSFGQVELGDSRAPMLSLVYLDVAEVHLDPSVSDIERVKAALQHHAGKTIGKVRDLSGAYAEGFESDVEKSVRYSLHQIADVSALEDITATYLERSLARERNDYLTSNFYAFTIGTNAEELASKLGISDLALSYAFYHVGEEIAEVWKHDHLLFGNSFGEVGLSDRNRETLKTIIIQVLAFLNLEDERVSAEQKIISDALRLEIARLWKNDSPVNKRKLTSLFGLLLEVSLGKMSLENLAGLLMYQAALRKKYHGLVAEVDFFTILRDAYLQGARSSRGATAEISFIQTMADKGNKIISIPISTTQKRADFLVVDEKGNTDIWEVKSVATTAEGIDTTASDIASKIRRANLQMQATARSEIIGRNPEKSHFRLALFLDDRLKENEAALRAKVERETREYENFGEITWTFTPHQNLENFRASPHQRYTIVDEPEIQSGPAKVEDHTKLGDALFTKISKLEAFSELEQENALHTEKGIQAVRTWADASTLRLLEMLEVWPQGIAEHELYRKAYDTVEQLNNYESAMAENLSAAQLAKRILETEAALTAIETIKQELQDLTTSRQRFSLLAALRADRHLNANVYIGEQNSMLDEASSSNFDEYALQVQLEVDKYNGQYGIIKAGWEVAETIERGALLSRFSAEFNLSHGIRSRLSRTYPDLEIPVYSAFAAFLTQEDGLNSTSAQQLDDEALAFAIFRLSQINMQMNHVHEVLRETNRSERLTDNLSRQRTWNGVDETLLGFYQAEADTVLNARFKSVPNVPVKGNIFPYATHDKTLTIAIVRAVFINSILKDMNTYLDTLEDGPKKQKLLEIKSELDDQIETQRGILNPQNLNEARDKLARYFEYGGEL